MVLSSVLVALVGSTFLVQNRYYSSQTLFAGAHDNARVATERVASELRSAVRDGIVVAGAGTLTVRSPIVVAMVCGQAMNDIYVHFEGGASGLDTDEVAGIAMRDSLTSAWTYGTATWASLDQGASSALSVCYGQGADTTGATAEFRRLGPVNGILGAVPPTGVPVMLYRETTFKIQGSALEPGRLALFRRIYGGSFVEFATGMDSTAQFQYRTGGSTYADTINAASLGLIDAVRIVADAHRPARSGVQQDVTFGWDVTVSLGDAP